MKVAVDARHLAGGRGVGEYTRGMLAALSDVEILRVERRGRASYASAALLGRPRLDRLAGGDPHVVWAPAPAPLAVSAGVPFVLTVHDLSWLERPGDFTTYERVWHAAGRLRRLARRADRVVVDAAATVGPLTRWGVDRDRIRVVHPGVPHRPVGALPPGLPERYALFVGALEPRKDPELLANADLGGLPVVFAGAGRLAPRLRGGTIHVIEQFAPDQLGALYANALALVMPSRLEGFGFPPLEAALHGTPSVVTDLPVFDETLGDAALKIVPGDARGLGEAVRRLAEDATLRSDLGERARTRAARFTWAEAARGLRAVFAEVAR